MALQPGKWIERALVAVGPAFMAYWLVGWLAKDATTWTRWAFFIPPLAPLLLGLIWLGATRDAAGGAARSFVKGVLLIAAGKLLLVDMQWHGRIDPPPDAVRVAQWNIARGTDRLDEVFRQLARSKPDLCLVSESPPHDLLAAHAREHLGLTYMLPDAGMTLLSRYPLEFLGSLRITAGRAWAVRTTLPNGPVDIVAFDLVSRPDLDRVTPMNELADWLARRPRQVPVLVLGDFNTPRDSLSFRPIRKHLVNAHEKAGSGWPYTWPFPLPAYAIDHAWVSPQLQVFNHRHVVSRWSDHLQQSFVLRVPTPMPAGTNAASSGW